MSIVDRQRRVFLIALAATGCAVTVVRAQAQAMVDPKEPQAAALGYVSEAAAANTARFPKYAAGQMCGTCALYQGKAGESAGPCPLFAGKQVSAKGWCSAWSKKG